MIDAEDREIIAQGFAYLVTAIFGLLMLAAGAGLAWRIFEMLGGL